jgi:hypothetical protein
MSWSLHALQGLLGGSRLSYKRSHLIALRTTKIYPRAIRRRIGGRESGSQRLIQIKGPATRDAANVLARHRVLLEPIASAALVPPKRCAGAVRRFAARISARSVCDLPDQVDGRAIPARAFGCLDLATPQSRRGPFPRVGRRTLTVACSICSLSLGDAPAIGAFWRSGRPPCPDT